MAGRSTQGKRKSEKRLADLAMRPPKDVGYVALPPEECEEYTYSLDPSGGNMTKERLKVRLVQHVLSDGLAEFAVIHETNVKGRWVPVAVADSSHGDEVHVHWHGRRAGGRVGEPELLKLISTMDDVHDGYLLAYDVIVNAWEDNKRRWDHA